VFTRSSKRPAIHVYFEYICWKFAGRLLDCVNTLSDKQIKLDHVQTDQLVVICRHTTYIKQLGLRENLRHRFDVTDGINWCQNTLYLLILLLCSF